MRVKPFAAYRPSKEHVSKVASYPYDLMGREEYRQLVTSEDSFIRVVRSDVDFEHSVDDHDELVYAKANENLQALIKKHALIRDDGPCFYIYEEIMDGRSQLGLVCACPVEAYQSGEIRRHELTLEPKVQDRMCHMEATGMQTGSVFLTYRESDGLDEVMTAITKHRDPVVDFTYINGVRQRLWVVCDDDAIQDLQKHVESISRFYIVDGHHRMEAASRLYSKGGSSHMLCTMVASKRLLNMANHRVIHQCVGEDIMQRVGEVATVTPCMETFIPERKGEVGIYHGGRWYRMVLGGSKDELDVSRLQSSILAPILGVQHPSTDPRFESIGDIHGIDTVIKSADDNEGIGFIMHPPTVEDMMDLADQGQTMPPKSTWFEPKLLSGLFVRSHR